jgi:NADH dehydrogenase
MGRQPRVVIVGGGFGGLSAARALSRSRLRVTLVDRRNFHLFQPLLYQVATGGLSPANIAAPLRGVLRRQRNALVLLAEAVDLDADRHVLSLSDGALDYDALVVATGSTHHYFGNERWAPLAPGLKTLEDATEIRRRVLLAFETAEREPDPASASRRLTFVVIGAGPTGVELPDLRALRAAHHRAEPFASVEGRGHRGVCRPSGGSTGRRDGHRQREPRARGRP